MCLAVLTGIHEDLASGFLAGTDRHLERLSMHRFDFARLVKHFNVVSS